MVVLDFPQFRVRGYPLRLQYARPVGGNFRHVLYRCSVTEDAVGFPSLKGYVAQIIGIVGRYSMSAQVGPREYMMHLQISVVAQAAVSQSVTRSPVPRISYPRHDVQQRIKARSGVVQIKVFVGDLTLALALSQITQQTIEGFRRLQRR